MKAMIRAAGRVLHVTLIAAVVVGVAAGSTRTPAPGESAEASAQRISLTASKTYDEVEAAVETAQGRYVPADKGARQDLLKRLSEALAEGTVVTHLDGAAFDKSRATVAEARTGGQLVMTIPLRGPSMVEPSNLTVAFDAHGAVTSTIEVQYRGDGDAEQGRVTTWTDGELTLDTMVNSEGERWAPGSAAPPQSDTDQVQLAWSFSKFLDCLNAQGVSGWVVTAISIACAAACAATAGAGCLGCIAAAGSVTSGVIGACVYIAGK